MREFDRLAEEVKTRLPLLRLQTNEPMRAHCSFRIGGRAGIMAYPASAEETAELCTFLREKGVKPLVIGNGTNLLVTDEDLRRFVINMSETMGAAERTGGAEIKAQCGISLARLAVFAAENALTGLEFAHGIPGTLGGAVSMNAGAYGGEMKQVLSSVMYLDENLKLCEKSGEALNMGYRHSAFSDTDCVILSARLSLTLGEGELISARMRELSEKRRASQPLDKPSAGSTFKRPEQGYAAALIEQAGLKGFAIGGAQVSEKHAGFVINTGNASFDDVMRLIAHIRQTVLQKTGILLEPEIKIIENTAD